MTPGGESAFESEVGPLLPRLRSIVRRMVSDRALAEDAVQEALLRAYRFRDQRRGDAVWPWLRKIVVRECWRLLRQRSAKATDPFSDDVRAETGSPEERVLLEEEYAEVRRAVERMPAGYQRVLRLRYGYALGEREIAAILGLPPGTVRWRLKRAHDHLRLVLTVRHAPPLAATLREVIRDMKIRVSTERQVGPLEPPPPGVEWSGLIQYERVTLDQAMAAIPEFRLSAALMDEHPGLELRLGCRGPDATSGPNEPDNIYVTIPNGLAIACRAPTYCPTELTECFPGANIGVDEDTQVGGQYGHWTKVNSSHFVWWFSRTGAFWMVSSGQVPPEEIRRVAESIEAEAVSPAE